MYGIVANVLNDRILRTGAKVWLKDINGDAERQLVEGLNKSGRTVEKYIPRKRLGNYRAAWIPEHLREGISWKHRFATREEAEKVAADLAEMWAGIRFYMPDGQIKQEGEPDRVAYERAKAQYFRDHPELAPCGGAAIAAQIPLIAEKT